jgi:hypothetical protein
MKEKEIFSDFILRFLCWYCLDKIRFQKLKRNVFASAILGNQKMSNVLNLLLKISLQDTVLGQKNLKDSKCRCSRETRYFDR